MKCADTFASRARRLHLSSHSSRSSLVDALTNPQRHVPTGRVAILAVSGVLAASTAIRAWKRRRSFAQSFASLLSTRPGGGDTMNPTDPAISGGRGDCPFLCLLTLGHEPRCAETARSGSPSMNRATMSKTIPARAHAAFSVHDQRNPGKRDNVSETQARTKTRSARVRSVRRSSRRRLQVAGRFSYVLEVAHKRIVRARRCFANPFAQSLLAASTRRRPSSAQVGAVVGPEDQPRSIAISRRDCCQARGGRSARPLCQCGEDDSARTSSATVTAPPISRDAAWADRVAHGHAHQDDSEPKTRRATRR